MAYNTNSGGKVYRPYRKASEYLTTQQKSSVPIAGPKLDLEKENEALRQKVLNLTRNLDHAEAEYSQSREYLESQLDVANDKLQRVSSQYKTLQSSYVSLQSTNRELESKVAKVINRLENERGSMVQEINDLTRKITEARNNLLKSQEENERLRKDCNLAVQLLKCNQSSYSSQRPEQIPSELQERVSDYQMKLQDYNEYINPYADSDSDNEDRTRPPKSSTKDTGNPISTDLLAQVLQKPENVHMNLEAADFIQDPQLTATYKARYTERKLIKPDYGEENHQEHIQPPNSLSATNTSTSSPWEQTSGSGKLSSPWEQTQETSSESSPWERRIVPTGSQYVDDDDEAPAGAYGAYAVGSRRKMPKRTPELKQELNLNLPREPIIQPSHSVPSSPEELDFRKPAVPDAYVASTFLAKAADIVASSVSSSKSSSQKSSPYKMRGKVSASKAETSSLLTGDDSEDEDREELSVSQTQSPKKSYVLNEQNQPEGLGLLDKVEDDMDDLHDKEITLEWDPTDVYEEELPAQLEDETNKTKLVTNVTTPTTQENLLLSYSEMEAKKESETTNLEDLLNMNIETGTEAMNNVCLSPNETPESGHLLSEIVHGNPSFESFLLTTPPPPQEFASTDTESHPTDAIYTEVDFKTTGNHTEQVDNNVLTNGANFSVQSNDVIEVIDLDLTEDQPDARRRNSFEQAREYGNVMD